MAGTAGDVGQLSARLLEPDTTLLGSSVSTLDVLNSHGHGHGHAGRTAPASSLPAAPTSLPPPTSVIRARSGTVLARGMILKRDYFPKTLPPAGAETVFFQGAPQFRSLVSDSDLRVFGTAQPTEFGIESILTSLGSRRPTNVKTTFVSLRAEPLLFLSSRAFTLRMSSAPLHNLASYAGISPGRLEALEQRLLEDVLEEAERFGGMLLVHDEIRDSKVIPTWIAISRATVATPAQLFEKLSKSYEVDYYRLPLSPESAPSASYIDDYLRILERAASDPIVLSCGRGVGRTTWAMLAVGLVRNRQRSLENGAFGRSMIRPRLPTTIEAGLPDRADSESPRKVGKRRADPRERPMEEEMGNRALLRVLYVLEKALPQLTPHSTLTSLLASPPLLSDLKLAIQGSYTLITQLLAILPSGIKTAVDALIDSNALLVNLRENILVERARSLNGGEELEKAVCALERYFWLIALAGYLEEALAPQQSNGSDPSPRAMCSSLFSEWVAKQAWISATTTFVHARPLKPSALSFFAPLGDLTYLVRPPTGAGHLALYAAGSVGTELESWVVRSRRGAVLASQLLLKVDLWAETDWGSAEGTRTRPPSGTGSFRKIPAVPVYASSQPALPALSSILAEIGGEEPAPQRLIWINLREEPIIYIQEHPHVLRQTGKALRNLRSYTGITPTNLEKIEDKLAEDVKSELEEYGGKVLVHTEKDGEVVPVWVDAKESDVRTVREVFGALIDNGLEVDYHRIPTTAEQPPQEEDFDDLLNLLLQHEWDGHSTAVVFNCQMGVGRSTTGTVVATLILYWLRGTRPTQRSERRSYHAINALLRVLRNGVSAKTTADLAIDACGAKVNLRDCVDEWRRRAEKEAGQGRTIYLKRALKCLERYWIVILFQAFLDTHSPKDFSSSRRPTFKAWIAAHAEFATLRLEMLAGDVESLTPLLPHADSDVSEASVIASRSGSVLASQTILKPDLFPGCQKKTLKDRVEGAPNYRRIPLSDMKQEAERVKLALLEDPWGSENEIAAAIVDDLAGGPYAIGEAMPSASGIVHVAERSHADPDGPRSMLWTSLREEPVIYIFGEAYVLRVFNDPFKNLVITGITAERVETMEKRLKEDVLREAERYGGKILLHIEEATPDGFALVPVWEAVQESDVQTPRELYGGIISQGYRISYARVPITDEQAPIPMVFDVLLRRVLDRGYDSDMVFNCQMGRGRTTTGLAIACLAEMIVGNMALVGGDRERGLPGTKPGVRPLPRSPTTQEDLVDRYSARGEYQLILSLLPVLSHGKLAKRLTDRTLDLCSHMQNLREAIYAFRVAGEEKKKEALNYLVRYFYLIVFADYLLVEWVSGEGRQSFEAWLSERGEITSILRKQTLD